MLQGKAGHATGSNEYGEVGLGGELDLRRNGFDHLGSPILRSDPEDPLGIIGQHLVQDRPGENRRKISLLDGHLHAGGGQGDFQMPSNMPIQEIQALFQSFVIVLRYGSWIGAKGKRAQRACEASQLGIELLRVCPPLFEEVSKGSEP